jgi:hypothetical protein
MKDESKLLYLNYTEKFQEAIKEDNFINAFQIILSGVKAADKKKDHEAGKAILNLIKALDILISNKYGILHLYHLGTQNHRCSLCGLGYREDELLLGTTGAICKNCTVFARETLLVNTK